MKKDENVSRETFTLRININGGFEAIINENEEGKYYICPFTDKKIYLKYVTLLHIYESGIKIIGFREEIE